MLSFVFQVICFASYGIIMGVVWCVSRRPGWKARSVIYGWGASVLWTLLWCIVLPWKLRGAMDKSVIDATFPDGAWVGGFISCGWLAPLIVANFRDWRNRAALERAPK